MLDNIKRLIVPRLSEGMRLDLFLLTHAPAETTRGMVQRLIREDGVCIAGKRIVKPSTPVRAGQEIHVQRGAWEHGSGTAETPERLNVPLRILHADRDLLVLDKPAGVPVHQGVRREPSIADGLVARFPDLRGVGEHPQRPGIVHRLDKDTSGILLVARTPGMYLHLKRQFQNRLVRKEYRVLVHGVVPEDEGAVKLPLTRSKRNPLRRTIAKGVPGKEAETWFSVLERFREHTLLAVYPKTGRMHQIRVHLAHLGFPVAGDSLYGRRSRYRTPPGLRRQFLHAWSLTVTLPSGKSKTFESPLPEDLAAVLEKLRTPPEGPSSRPLSYRWRTPRSATHS